MSDPIWMEQLCRKQMKRCEDLAAEKAELLYLLQKIAEDFHEIPCCVAQEAMDIIAKVTGGSK